MTRSPAGPAWLLAVSTAALVACSPATEPSETNPQGGNAGSGGTQPVVVAGSGGSTATAGTGTGGAAVTAGTGGTAGVSAVAGSSGAGGQGTPGEADAVQPSAGCGKPAEIEPGAFVMSTLMGRSVWIRLPTDYDPARPYPVIFVWKGCSAPGIASYGLQNVAGADAIIAQADFPPGEDCYDTSDGAMFVDLPVFDALLEQIKGNHCADTAHVFSVGFSSGAWMTQLLACQRGDVLRGIGTIAGAFKPAFLNGAPSCKGEGLSAFMVSDLDDHTNPFYDEDVDGDSVEVAVNHWLVQNGCTEQVWSTEAGTPSSPDESVCRAYSDCGRFPVKLCLTAGNGHSAQEALSMPGFWELFQQSLPK